MSASKHPSTDPLLPVAQIESSPSPESVNAGRAIGAMIFACFGGAWLVLWSFRGLQSRRIAVPLIVVGAVVNFSIALIRYRRYGDVAAEEDESPAKKRANRLFQIINAAQWVAILIVGNVLVNIHLSPWLLPSAIFILGLRFLPLAAIPSNPAHYVTAALFILLSVCYPFLAPQGPNSAIGCLGAGLILWASAVWAVTTNGGPNMDRESE
jgi:hypothetical protein